MNLQLRFLLGLMIFVEIMLSNGLYGQEGKIPAPLFVDPNYHGSCDPEIVWNTYDQQWYIYYTARRSALENTWLATPIGVIRSKDMVKWEFLGYCKFDGKDGKKDAGSTFWAPAIIADNGKLQMFVTWKPDTVPDAGPWGGPGKIVHYETPLEDPVTGWKKVDDMHGPELRSIDATVYKKDNTFHLWYKAAKKDEAKSELYHFTSMDLYQWENKGFSKSDVFNRQATGSGFEEAPYIFQWKGRFWLITDPHKGLFVYKSDDGEHWRFQGTIMEEGSLRPLDNSMARHCSVSIVNDRAFIFYHVEPWRDYDSAIFRQPLKNRASVLQMAELKLQDDKIVCDRNEAVMME